jgi:hypothetical protein
MRGHRAHLPGRAAAGDDQKIGDAGFVSEIGDQNVLGLVGIERLDDRILERLGRGG